MDNGNCEKLNFQAWDGTSPVKQEVITDSPELSVDFDEREYFNGEIMPLLKSILEKCEKRHIPVLCSVAFSHGDDGSGLCNTACLPGIRTPMLFRVITKILEDKNHRLLNFVFTSLAASAMMETIQEETESGENKQ